MLFTQIAAATLMAIPVVVSLVYLFVLSRLRRSPYSILLRLACATLPICVICNWAYFNIAGFDTIPINTFYNMIKIINYLIFFLSQLEFLRVISPFINPVISSTTITVGQTIMILFGIIDMILVLLRALSILADQTAWAARELGPIFIGIIVIYETLQHCFMLHFVMYRLKHKPTLSFKVHFSALIILSLLLALPTNIYALFAEPSTSIPGLPPPLRFLVDASAMSFEFCGFQAMLLLQQMINRPVQVNPVESNKFDTPDTSGIVPPWNGINADMFSSLVVALPPMLRAPMPSLAAAESGGVQTVVVQAQE